MPTPRLTPFLIVTLAATLTACGDSATHEVQTVTTLKGENQYAAYAIGQQMGEQLKRVEGSVEVDIVIQGLLDTVNKTKPLADAVALQTALQAFEMKQAQQKQFVFEGQMRELKAKAEQYLAENAKKTGVQVLDDGVQLQVLSLGKGAKPTDNAVVSLHYKGTLADGTVFDDTVARGQPLTIVLNQAIPALQIALAQLPAGSKAIVTAPPKQAYGEAGAPGKIPPGAVVIFELVLLSVVQ